MQSVQEFGDVVVSEREGHPILLRDVAIVEDGMADATTRANVSGKPTVLLAIRRQSGVNTVQMVDAVRERLTDIKAVTPPGYEVVIVRDLSDFIRASIDTVEEHLILGSVLAALVVLVFLWNWRSTLIAAIAIPTSIIATFGLIWYEDFTLNSMTMLALTLAVGIVIDDAIVVLENIYRFVEEKGMNPYEAAVEATKEIGLAVMATTLSLIAIFVPVGFMGGIVGRFMKSFGLTMSFAILVSLLVSFTLTPMLSARWIKAKKDEKEKSSKEGRFFRPLDIGYGRALSWALGHRGLVAGLTVLILLSTVPLFMLANKNFLPEDDQSEFEVGLRAPEGTSIDTTELIANRIATEVRALPEVDYTLVTIADDPAQTQNSGTIYVRLKPLKDRKRDQFAIMDAVRTGVMPQFASANLRTGVRPVATFGGGGNQNAEIQFTISGPDLGKLEKFAGTVADQARKQPGVVDVDTSLNVGKPELSVHLDRLKAADLGVEVADAAEALRLLVGGDQVTTYNEGGEQYEVHVRALAAGRATAAGVGQMTVPSTTLGSVPLENIADLTLGHVAEQRGPVESAAAGDGLRGPPAGGLADAGDGCDDEGGGGAEHGTRLQLAVRGPVAGARARRAELPDRVRALAGVHVSDPRGAVRVVAPSGHDPAVAAAHAAVRAAVHHRDRAVAEHLFGARTARAVRRRQEELDSPDRSRESAQGKRHGTRHRDSAGQPRSAAPDSHDHARVRRRHDPPRPVERDRLRHEPRDRLRHHRRAVARAGAVADRDAGGLLPARRPVEGPHLGADPRDSRPAAGVGDGRRGAARCASCCRHRRGADHDRRGPADHGGPGRAHGDREQPRPGRGPVRPGHQRGARARGARGLPADAVERHPAQRAAGAAEQHLPRQRGDADRRLVRQRRPRTAVAVGRRLVHLRLELAAIEREQLAVELQPVRHGDPPGGRVAAPAARLQDRSARAQVTTAEKNRQIADIGLAGAGIHAVGQCAARLLEPGAGAGRGGGAAAIAGSVARAPADQQGARRRRPVAAARPGRRRARKSRSGARA